MKTCRVMTTGNEKKVYSEHRETKGVYKKEVNYMHFSAVYSCKCGYKIELGEDKQESFVKNITKARFCAKCGREMKLDSFQVPKKIT